MFSDARDLWGYVVDFEEAAAHLDAKGRHQVELRRLRLVIQAIISLVVLGLAFALLFLNSVDSSVKQAASGMIGAVAVVAVVRDDENRGESAGVAVLMIPMAVVLALSARPGFGKVRACSRAKLEYRRAH